MGLTPDEIAELTDEISLWFTQDYIALGFWSFYLYHYLTTLAEEVSTIWPQKWRTGKILFLLLRYIPICCMTLAIFMELRIHMDLTPKVCHGVNIAYTAADIDIGIDDPLPTPVDLERALYEGITFERCVDISLSAVPFLFGLGACGFHFGGGSGFGADSELGAMNAKKSAADTGIGDTYRLCDSC
ncbi:hypothetical protein DFP72DRAFT_1079317 [Ephemerocybe angulata]|uniref:DUF6533 domain-containing protein n=1 Tax=Ephemerocybe angulata TaxID=980116 RepID=A0A8H6LV71_9AGAR|nr:hypothetical protein DFP72DRAFT_1079317 [Tulosesus angulatus]